MHRSSEKFYYPISDLTLRRVSKSLDNLIRSRSRYHFSMYYRSIAFYRRRQITEIHLRDWKDVMRVDMKHLHVSVILAWSVSLKTFLKGRQSRDKLPLRFQFILRLQPVFLSGYLPRSFRRDGNFATIARAYVDRSFYWHPRVRILTINLNLCYKSCVFHIFISLLRIMYV